MRLARTVDDGHPASADQLEHFVVSDGTGQVRHAGIP
jgi:hypothetical protein